MLHGLPKAIYTYLSISTVDKNGSCF